MIRKLALFDCDGTLVDSHHSIVESMNDAFAKAGLEPPGAAAIRRVIGLSLVQSVAVLVPKAGPDLHIQIAEDYKTSFQQLRRNGHVQEPLYDGIVDTLIELRDDGWALGVATGKSDRGLDLCLRHHGIKDWFVTLQTADRHPSKPHPSMVYEALAEAGASRDTTIMIGDTSFDIAMARAAGLRALGVDWGYHPAEELRLAGAYHVAGHPREVKDLMK